MKKTKAALFLIIFALLGQGCAPSDSGGGGGGASLDPNANALAAGSSSLIQGNWYYISPNSTQSQASGMIADIKADGTILILSLKGAANASSASFFFRKSVGTYTMSGGQIKLTYSYETCNPVGHETLNVNIPNSNTNLMYVSDIAQSVLITMKRSTTSSPDLSLTLVEDVNCNKM